MGKFKAYLDRGKYKAGCWNSLFKVNDNSRSKTQFLPKKALLAMKGIFGRKISTDEAKIGKFERFCKNIQWWAAASITIISKAYSLLNTTIQRWVFETFLWIC